MSDNKQQHTTKQTNNKTNNKQQHTTTTKLESYDDSVLLRFMLRRSLRNPLVVGHKLFWLLRSELHNRESLGRYGLLLELYVINCGPHRDPLSKIHHTGIYIKKKKNSLIPSRDPF